MLHTNRGKVLQSVMVHLWARSVGITLLQRVILQVQHDADLHSLVKLRTELVPKHERHCAALVSNFKIRLKYNKTQQLR